MKRILPFAVGLLALAAPATAQTDIGPPPPDRDRAEQRTTADRHQRVDDDTAAAWGDSADAAPPQPDRRDDDTARAWGDPDEVSSPPRADRAPTGRYDDERAVYERDLAEDRRARAEYRRRSAEHRADIARWRERVAACDAGVRRACAGYEHRRGSYADGRYTAPTEPGDGYVRRADRYHSAPTAHDEAYDAPDDRSDGDNDDYDDAPVSEDIDPNGT